MRVALLSAGPSLEHFDRTIRSECFSARIGVNTAAAKYPVDYWSVADQDRFAEIHPIGFPAVFTMGPERDKMMAQNPHRIARHRVLVWKDIGRDVHAPNDGWRWSCTSALILARWLGATEIDCYGVDMTGAADVTGQTTIYRNPERWAEEQVLWAKLVRWLRAGGTVVRRHLPDGMEVSA